MEMARELFPFIREMLRQKPSRGLLKVYLVGSVLAVLGSVLGEVSACLRITVSSVTDKEHL
uniref:G0/G1 switch 2 n=1 Tax=Cyprinus carpio TaxID=7962 RepID=A0A8C2KVT5_CYPCA